MKKNKKVTCEACGAKYTAGAPHNAFCLARTCTLCETTVGYVLDIYDSRTNPPERRCQKCLDEECDRINEGE